MALALGRQVVWACLDLGDVSNPFEHRGAGLSLAAHPTPSSRETKVDASRLRMLPESEHHAAVDSVNQSSENSHDCCGIDGSISFGAFWSA